MKKILITGANSFIGCSFDAYMKKFSNEYIVDTIDLLDPDWLSSDFSSYDAIVHVAGIAHQKETKHNAHIYYQINCELAVQTAKKAKDAGVKHFVFFSTMSVYGKNKGKITLDTKPKPNTHYGRSKLMAEKELQKLQDDSFNVSVIRPPMVYGKNCKGNFPKLLHLIKVLPVFPKINNVRSMIYIEHLSVFIKMIIDRCEPGVFFPQNKNYVSTLNLAQIVSVLTKRKIFFSYLLGIFVFVSRPFVRVLSKAFCNLQYIDTEKHSYEYSIYDFDETISRSI